MNWGRLYFGSLIVVVGIVLLLDNADVLDAGDVMGDWWPAALIVAGLLMFVSNPGHWAGPLIVAAIGVAFLLSTLEIADVSDFLWPAIIVAVGLMVIFGRGSRSNPTEAGDEVNSFNMFSGSELASHSKEFRGGSVTAVFGGAEVDLTDAVPAPDAELDVFTAFGAVEVTVPTGWQVTLSGFPLFGGFENATAKDTVPADAPRLIINATALFGGVEVKH
ncbi:MAG: DUF5668 domain-containing protein [Actinomycetota bacterium]|nr:DUF5668 domain-containing protein [Actinomycetota bacterium]